MLGPQELQDRIGQMRVEEYRRQAEEARLISTYLRETRTYRSWRFRLAEALLGLVTRLTPYHRTLVQAGRHNTMGS